MQRKSAVGATTSTASDEELAVLGGYDFGSSA